MSELSRRGLLAGACGAALTVDCGRSHAEEVVRVGFMTNLTHAPAIAGLTSGRFARALGARVESRSFRTGPRVVEALVGDAIDVGVAGPAPILYTHARHGAGTLRVLAGCASGGASFVVSTASGIVGPGDLRGKAVATPQIGTTQDIALRKYLRAHGYKAAERGGDVTVHALDAATILEQMRRGTLDGAWLPEPWATRIAQDTGALRLVDERDLWRKRAFPTALLVARGDFVRRRAVTAFALADALATEVDRALSLPSETRAAVREELGRLFGRPLPVALIDEAWRWIDFMRDPLPDALETIADDAWALGLAPQMSCRTLFG